MFFLAVVFVVLLTILASLVVYLAYCGALLTHQKECKHYCGCNPSEPVLEKIPSNQSIDVGYPSSDLTSTGTEYPVVNTGLDVPFGDGILQYLPAVTQDTYISSDLFVPQVEPVLTPQTEVTSSFDFGAVSDCGSSSDCCGGSCSVD